MQRQEQIKQWLAEFFSTDAVRLEVASADASFRQYFRTEHNGVSYIVMDAPPDKEPLEPFVSLTKHFRAHGLNTPHIYAKDEAQGFLLLTDFGTTSYLDVLNTDSADKLYRQAIDAIAHLQRFPADNLPAYDAALLDEEINLFVTWYLGEHLNITLDNDQSVRLQKVFDTLVHSALEQPVVSVHRDFHARNLMVVEEHNPGIIDFQDAVAGPLCYDLVSLLKDCYIAWPDAKVDHWVRYYYDKMSADTNVGFGDFIRWFDYMGVQRHLKAIGIFARLNYRDGKPGYMGDISRVMAYVRAMAEKYPALKSLHEVCIIDEHCI